MIMKNDREDLIFKIRGQIQVCQRACSATGGDDDAMDAALDILGDLFERLAGILEPEQETKTA